MTWLDVGNGWRNIYLLSTLFQAFCLGTVFAWRQLFSRRSRLACFLTGVAVTPFLQYLCTMLLGLVIPHAPRAVYLLLPPVVAAALFVWAALRQLRQAKETGGFLAVMKKQLRGGLAFCRRCLRFDKATLCCLIFVLCMALLLLPPAVRLMTGTRATDGADCDVYLGMAQRFCEERDAGALFAKEDTTGTYRCHSHFPSMEFYLSYGLFHTGGEIGYPNDKPAFTALGLLIFDVLAAYAALLAHVTRERKGPMLLGLLLVNLVPNLYASVASAPRDIWRILGVLLLCLVFAGLTEEGTGRVYSRKLLLSFGACFLTMSTHVVCFVVAPFIVIAWGLSRLCHQLRTRRGGLKQSLIRTLGLCLSGAAGTVLAFLGNLWCWFKWGEMSPWRLMTTYTEAPWYESYMAGEYKLTETTTHLNFLKARSDILVSYSTHLGDFALILSLVMLIVCVVALVKNQLAMRGAALPLERAAQSGDGPVHIALNWTTPRCEQENGLLFISLVTLLTLAPMSGILDTSYYCFSGTFVSLPRYTLQWFFLGGAAICAALAAMQAQWGEWMAKLSARFAQIRESKAVTQLLPRVPAYLCALLCLIAFAKGVNQTGYTNTFYRSSRNVMEEESGLVDNTYQSRFAFLTAAADCLGEEDNILLSRDSYQYPLHSRGLTLLANPVVPLMNMTEEEIPGALETMQVKMVATEPDFWDERYFAKSTLAAYLNTLPKEQVLEDDTMRVYVLDEALLPAVQEAYAQTHPETEAF